MTVSPDLLRLKLAESLASETGMLTRRDAVLPGISGKAFAVIGVRRGGKTSFLAQLRADRIAAGRPRESQLLLSLEDERLEGPTAADLGWLLEEHARQFPGMRDAGGTTVYLDEVQTVPGWEGLVRRLMDQGGVELFVSGSSAKLLSREVATSLRGRAMEVLVHPFSFRETLRHAGVEPKGSLARMHAGDRVALDARLRRYLAEGGFPEAQGATARDRAALLSSYVDVMVLRDVIERHAVSNPLALRWIERQLLANPGGAFSVKKHYDTLRSQGVSVGKDTQLPATHPAKVRIIEVSSKIWKIRALIPTPSSSHPTCGSRMRMVNTTFKSGNGVRTDCLPNPSTLTRRMCCGERPVIAGDMAC